MSAYHREKETDDYYLGIEIGGTKLQVVLGDSEATIVLHRRMAVDKSRGAAGIREKIAAAIKDILSSHSARSVGVGFGGPVDFERGKIAVSFQVGGWADFEIGLWLEELTGLPVLVENDANTAALAEAHKGAGRGYSKLFYVTLGSGVGGGLVVDGRIYHGAKPGESEIGLMCYDKAGSNIESRCSGWAVDAKIRRYVSEHPESVLAGIVGKDRKSEARYLVQAMRDGDSGARLILDETAEDLAFGLSHAVHLFHPEIIVLGGGLSLIGEPLRQAVSGFLPRFITEAFLPGPEVAIAGIGENVVCVGALLLAKQKCKR